MKKASIIVPAYNVEDYVERCVSSIQKQTYTNIEIIVVDDGSNDKTRSIVENLALGDGRIVVLHQENMGVLVARNRGTEVASGDYGFFVDADDWIEASMIEKMMEKAELYDADLVFSGLVRENSNLISKKKDSIEEIRYEKNDIEGFYRLLFKPEDEKGTGVFLSVCSKGIRMSVLKSIMSDRLELMRNLEDTAVLLGCCFTANSVVVMPDAFYHYCMRSVSATHRNNIDYLQDLNRMYKFVRKYADNNPYSKTIREGLDVFFVDQCLRGMSIFYDLDEKAKYPYYLFPQESFFEGSKVIIYGAGRVGEAYYYQLSKNDSIDICAWIDRNYREKHNLCMEVQGVEAINDIDYDYIIIALRFEEMARQVKEELISAYAIDENKIIWEKPIGILDKYIKG